MARSKSDEEMERVPPGLRRDQSIPTALESESLLEDAESSVHGQIEEPSAAELNVRSRLLGNYNHNHICGLRNCNHGTFSPRAPSLRSEDGSLDSTAVPFGSVYPGTLADDGSQRDTVHGILGDSISDSLTGSKSLSTTKWLAQKHGIKSQRWMYFSYYFPFVKWVRQYRWQWLRGDIFSALTMASFYIPMSLSLSSNLAHLPPINGLYSFVFNPLIYAFLGSCPQMVVGPEAAGSLLVGQVVKTSIEQGHSGDQNARLNAEIAGVVTAIAGSVIFVAGLCRLGFLDSVLSRPFLRGFISAIGFVILVDQLIPELGLSGTQKDNEVAHGSSAQKLAFLVRNIGNAHGLTTAVSATSIGVIMLFRYVTFPQPGSYTDFVARSNVPYSHDIPWWLIFQIVSLLSFCQPSSPGLSPGTKRACQYWAI